MLTSITQSFYGGFNYSCFYLRRVSSEIILLRRYLKNDVRCLNIGSVTLGEI